MNGKLFAFISLIKVKFDIYHIADIFTDTDKFTDRFDTTKNFDEKITNTQKNKLLKPLQANPRTKVFKTTVCVQAG